MKKLTGELEVKLRCHETQVMTSEDRLSELDQLVNEQKSRQLRLVDLVDRTLTRKYVISQRLKHAHDTANNIRTDNSVRYLIGPLSL